MKSWASYFSISLPLIRENLRRFWAIPAIGFLIYFLSGVFPILMSYGHINNMADYIGSCLANMNPLFMGTHLLLPIITAVVLFRYLQTSGSVTALHAMPFSRACLFNSNVLSGLLLCIGPMLINGIIFLLIAKPAYQQWAVLEKTAENIFSRPNILLWMGESTLIILSLFAVAVFAGIVTGSGILHFVAAFGFNFLVPGIYSVLLLYFDKFLWGYYTNSLDMLILGTNPFIQTLMLEPFSTKWVCYFLISSLVILAVSGVLYYKRKLERASEGFVFGFMIPVISFLIAFLGMTLMGFYFESLGNNLNGNVLGFTTPSLYLYGGFVAGALIFFLIGNMIAKKTPRVFNLPTLKSLGIYGIIIVLFFCTLQLDLTGYERRVPKPETVTGAIVTIPTIDSYQLGDARYQPNYYRVSETLSAEMQNFLHNPSTAFLCTPEEIQLATQLHDVIVEARSRLKEREALTTFSEPAYTLNPILLQYEPKVGLSIARRYYIPYDMLRDTEEFAKIYESSAFKKFYSFENLEYESLTSISLQHPLLPETVLASIIAPEQMQELLACMELDFQERTYRQHIDSLHNYASVQLQFMKKDTTGAGAYQDSLRAGIRLTDRHSIQWLKDNGYYDSLQLTAADVEQVQLNQFVARPDGTLESMQTADLDGFDLLVTNSSEIQQLLDSYESIQTRSDCHYVGFITLTPEAAARLVGPSPEYASGGVEADYSTRAAGQALYFSPDTLPAFLADRFEEGNL